MIFKRIKLKLKKYFIENGNFFCCEGEWDQRKFFKEFFGLKDLASGVL